MPRTNEMMSTHEQEPQLRLFPDKERRRYESLEAVSEEIERCLKCGLCRSACPVLAEVLDESGCARGRIALAEALREGEVTLSKIFSDRLSKCLNCKSCMEVCPSGIKVDEIVIATRGEIFSRGHFPLLKKLVFRHLLRRGRLLPPISKTIAFIERRILRCLPPSSPYRLLLPIVHIDRDRVLPVFAERTLMDEFGEVLRPKSRPKMCIGFFLGCSTNLIYTQVGRSVLRVLLGEGIEVIVPRVQGCCGMPVYSAGDRSTGLELANKNVEAFRDLGVDAIVTACASCGSALKNDYERILGLGKNPLGSPVYDLSEFLIRFASMAPAGSDAVGVKVTYHDPCHLNRAQGITQEPRQIIKAIPHVEFIEMEDSARCCGGGGLFSFTHYDIAKEIGRRKVRAIAATSADIVATACPSCIMQLDDILRRTGLPQRVMHIADLIAQCYPPLGVSLDRSVEGS